MIKYKNVSLETAQEHGYDYPVMGPFEDEYELEKTYTYQDLSTNKDIHAAIVVIDGKLELYRNSREIKKLMKDVILK